MLRSTLLSRALIATAVLLCIAASVSAQTGGGSAKLDAVTIEGSARYKSEQIAAAIGMKPGKSVDRDALQGGADKLSALGLFNSVTYKFASSPAGVRVSYTVADAPAGPVIFDNFPWVSDAEIVAAVRASGALFDGTAPAHGTNLDSIATAIEQFLDSRSIHARVSHKLVDDPATGQQVQQFRADDVTLTINSVAFSDDIAAKDVGLTDRVPDLVGRPYSRSLIELFTFEQVRPLYLGRGYLRAQFPAPVAKLAPGSANPLDAKLDVTIPIVPGMRYTWAGIQWTGNSGIHNDELNHAVELKPGDPLDANRLTQFTQHVEDLYHQRGYLDCKLDLQPHFDDKAGSASYSVTVTEGPQYHMGKLVLTGLSPEGERRIRKAWSIPEGAVFDESIYQEFIDHGIKAAFAGLPVHYEKPGHFLEQDAAASQVNVLLDFQ